MNAVRAAVLPESGAADHAGHYLGAGQENVVPPRPDLRLVRNAAHNAALSAAAFSATAPAATAPAALPRPRPARPARACAARADHPVSPLRLTRRGRVVAAVLTVLLAAALSLIVASAAQASHAGAAHPAGSGLAQVVVEPGQSLWSVAESADPDTDTRLVIQQITQLNSLNGDTVFAGQRLWVPRA